MIKLKYKLTRDEGDEIREFKPTVYPTEFQNQIYLMGPNGSGKSAILNIIALALYGNELLAEEIDDGLKRRIRNLVDSPHNELTFDLEITNEISGITIRSVKKDPKKKDINFTVVRNGKTKRYTKEMFAREFRVLYTIPNNPTEQLPELLNEIKVSQLEIARKISNFHTFLRDKITLLENSRDEDLLINTRNKLEELDSKYKDKLRELEDEEYDYNSLDKFLWSKYLLDGSSKLAKLLDDQKEVEQQISLLGKDVRKIKRAQKSGEKEFDRIMVSISNNFSTILKILRKYNFHNIHLQRFNTLKSASINNEVQNSKINRVIRDQTEFFQTAINGLLSSEKTASRIDLVSLDLYNSLLNILDVPNYSNIILPGTSESINYLIQNIKIARDSIIETKNKIDSIEEDANLIGRFRADLQNAIKYRIDFPVQLEDYQSDEEKAILELEQNKQSILVQTKEMQNVISKAKKELIRLNIDPNNLVKLEANLFKIPSIQRYKNMRLIELEEELKNLKQSISIKSFQSNQASELINDLRKEVSKLEKQDTNPDKIFLDNFKDLYRKINPIVKKFKYDFNDSINTIQKRDSKRVFDKNIIEFSEQIGKYYATKMKVVLYAGAQHDVSNVDIINAVIKTSNGKNIQFDELSTGQSQSSYLTTKLGMTDDKITIALFDEIAMMDETSLRPVVDLLKSKYEKGNVLCSIIIQRSEKVTVKEL